MTGRLKNLLAELRKGLETHYGPRLNGLILFGSRARGNAKGDSNVDVLVILKGKVSTADEIEPNFADIVGTWA